MLGSIDITYEIQDEVPVNLHVEMMRHKNKQYFLASARVAGLKIKSINFG